VILVRRIVVYFGLAAVLAGMATVVPAAASTRASLPQGQHLGKARLVGHSTPTNAATNLTEGTLASGVPAAFTDDPALVRSMTGAGGSAATFPQNSASTVLSGKGQQSGDSKEGAASSIKGLNAFTLGATHGFVVEPPDQGLCANSRYVIEMVNLNLRVYDSNLNAVSGPIVLETFFGDPLAFGFAGGDVTIQGDPRCVWDATSGRWFLSQLLIDLNASTSVFQVAVSESSNPLGSYNLYALDNTDSTNPGCPCLGDQPTMGANADALFIDTNEFGLNTNEFNGAVIYTIDKHALAEGEASANVVTDFVGMTVATPEWNSTTNCLGPIEGLYCWATIRPSTSPTGGDRRFGGVEYFLSALDFANVKDNRIAVWAMTNTRSIRSDEPNLNLVHKVMGSEKYIFPAFARQKAGPIPLGDSGQYSCEPHNPCATPTPQPEGMIQTNDDQFGSAVFADGLVWGGLTTTVPGTTQIGIGYFAVRPVLTKSGLGGSSIKLQGYLTAKGNDVYFPSIAVTADGHGLISFTLSGPNYFPSSGYALIDSEGAGKVKVAALGRSPQDGFTEYEFGNPTDPLHGQYRPRWGDYSAAVAVGDNFVFASEYIQYANCSDAAWTADHSCGGTRTRGANWGTSINTLSVGEEGKD
jgi:hypothetical protein